MNSPSQSLRSGSVESRCAMTKIMIMAVLISALPYEPFAANVLKVSTDNAPVGAKGKFRILMQNDIWINGLNFVLKYDPDIISPTRVTPLGRASALTGPAGNSFEGSKLGFLLFDVGGNRVPPDSASIFEVEYVVNDVITDSTTTEIAFVEGIAADSNLSAVTFEYIGGSIPITPSVGVRDLASTIPRTFSLSQNYPNPFNPSTTIHFELPRAVHVKLKVYNILGQEVMSVLDEKREVGSHKVTVDCSRIASGVYFYRLVAGSFVQTKKMLMIK